MIDEIMKLHNKIDSQIKAMVLAHMDTSEDLCIRETLERFLYLVDQSYDLENLHSSPEYAKFKCDESLDVVTRLQLEFYIVLRIANSKSVSPYNNWTEMNGGML